MGTLLAIIGTIFGIALGVILVGVFIVVAIITGVKFLIGMF